MKHCDASNWNSAQVRRWLENEGFREFWHFLEPDAPITGHDILSLTGKNFFFLPLKFFVNSCPVMSEFLTWSFVYIFLVF
jgi:hypothetical protein